MGVPSYRHLQCRPEPIALVLTLTDTDIQEEETSEGLAQELLAVTAEQKASRIVIDMARVRYISSVAFRPLLKLRKQLRASNGRLVLCGLSDIIGDVFYTTRLVSSTGSFDAPFEMAADVPAALALLSKDPPG